jgi:choline dehydrogenase
VNEEGVFDVQLAKDQGFLTSSTILHPKSRGRVSLRSASPDDMPLVEFHFLDHPDDLWDILIGLHEVRKIWPNQLWLQLQMDRIAGWRRKRPAGSRRVQHAHGYGRQHKRTFDDDW